MRSFDKKKNITKANILAEQRYLESKGIIKESFHEPDGTPIGVDGQHRPMKIGEGNQRDQNDLAMYIIQLSNELSAEKNPVARKQIQSDINDVKVKLQKLKDSINDVGPE